jgi:hypothetical protein
LHQQAHIEVNVYESASEFSEKGMAIGMAVNTQRALGKLVPHVEEMSKRAGAVTIKSSRIMLVSCYSLNSSLIIDYWRGGEADEFIGRWTPRRHESDRYPGGETW